MVTAKKYMQRVLADSLAQFAQDLHTLQALLSLLLQLGDENEHSFWDIYGVARIDNLAICGQAERRVLLGHFYGKCGARAYNGRA